MAFKECSKGHDLTVEDAYSYSMTNLRECRECAIGKKVGKRQARFTFDLMPPDYSRKTVPQSEDR
jgi:hypothetical protein